MREYLVIFMRHDHQGFVLEQRQKYEATGLINLLKQLQDNTPSGHEEWRSVHIELIGNKKS